MTRREPTTSSQPSVPIPARLLEAARTDQTELWRLVTLLRGTSVSDRQGLDEASVRVYEGLLKAQKVRGDAFHNVNNPERYIRRALRFQRAKLVREAGSERKHKTALREGRMALPTHSEPAPLPTELRLDDKTIQEVLRSLVKQLSAGEQDLLHAVYYEARSMRNVAGKMRLSEAAVRKRLAVVLNRLQVIVAREPEVRDSLSAWLDRSGATDPP